MKVSPLLCVMKILSIRKKGLGQQAGLRPNFDLLFINGNKINDNIDLRFHQSDDLLDVVYKDKTGRMHRSLIEKDYDDSLGVVLEELVRGTHSGPVSRPATASLDTWTSGTRPPGGGMMGT